MAAPRNSSLLSITLYRGSQGSGAYVWSPFVTKLEARLRFAGISYRTEAGSPLKAPRGKIPYVAISPKTADSGSHAVPVTATILADSTLITSHLVKDSVLDDLNAPLSPTETAHDPALRVLLEDKLYFYQVHERWHENYLHNAPAHSRRTTLLHPTRRRAVRVPQDQRGAVWAGHGAVLGGGDQLIQKTNLAER